MDMERQSLGPYDSEEGSFSTAGGTTDLMTSLAVVCMLLLAAQSVTGTGDNQSPSEPTASAVDVLRREMESDGLTIARADDPSLLRVVVPDNVLNFAFGKSALSPAADAFLTEAMPRYATVLCGSHGDEVETFVIEGHTDDQGDDIGNLKLSQERSFAVLSKSLLAIRDRAPWAYACFQRKVSANGRGSQELVRNALGFPDRERSRRVVFKLHLRTAGRG
ncbi:MAG: OmpA family protein [Nitrospira sp.]|nr:OmpA family protein [Nitrospira sp.]MCP9462331.1 OmpA family protein [Nitrospira sp.]MCP9474617.1 OmpA family protein [Nitrospira sp.]